MIHVHQLTKTYADTGSDRLALGGVSFDALPGQIFGLLGPNGAGKTTLLRILATVLRPSGGRATVQGYDVDREPGKVRRQLGFVSNNTAVYDRMTAYELVAYYGRLHDMTPESLRQRIDELFTQLDMHGIRDTLCSKMSTGMRQKVSIARALVHDPPVLIFDEATVGLDVLVARALLDIVLRLREQGKCILFSTHIMREAERLCDRIAIIDRGVILAQGSPVELLQNHEVDELEDLFFALIQAQRRGLSPWETDAGSMVSSGVTA